MQTNKLTGILGFPVSPFDKNGALDEHALHRNITFLIEEGLEAIFVACGAGEFHAISKAEYGTILDVAVDATQKRVPLYTGVGGNIQDALSFARLSEEKGADGYLILPPYLINGEQNGLRAYLSAIIESTSLHAIVYQRDNAVLEGDTLESLLVYPQLVGLKDGIGNMEQNIEFTQRFGERLLWLNGMPMAELTMPAYWPIGFHSYSSAISNYIPHISRCFFEALKRGNHEAVRTLYKDVLLPINVIRRQKKGYAVSLIKAGMEIVGLPVQEHVRAPLVPVEKSHYKQLAQILENAHKKYPRNHISL